MYARVGDIFFKIGQLPANGLGRGRDALGMKGRVRVAHQAYFCVWRN